MKRWVIKEEYPRDIVRLPDDAVVLNYWLGDEDNETALTYMVPIDEVKLLEKLSDEQRKLRDQCLGIIAVVRDRQDIEFKESMLERLECDLDMSDFQVISGRNVDAYCTSLLLMRAVTAPDDE